MKEVNLQNRQIQMLAEVLAEKRELTPTEIDKISGGMRAVDTWCPTSGCCFCADSTFIE